MAQGHGKVILLGEHSVVHGRPALALAVPGGAEVHATPAPSGPTRLRIEPWGVEVDTGEAPNEGREPLQRALRIARGFYADALELGLRATVRLPVGAGMGSSAALGVAVLRAMDEARGLSPGDDIIYERSLAWERVFHGNPSGVDNAMATHGGLARFRKGEPLTRLASRVPVRLVAGYSGQGSSTKLMVESVAQQLHAEPGRVGRLFDTIAGLVSQAEHALEQGDLARLGALMSHNHALLRELRLSTDALEELVDAARRAGALGAKVTGAGGGGCMIALVETDAQREAVRHALTTLGRPVYDVGSGV